MVVARGYGKGCGELLFSGTDERFWFCKMKEFYGSDGGTV